MPSKAQNNLISNSNSFPITQPSSTGNLNQRATTDLSKKSGGACLKIAIAVAALVGAALITLSALSYFGAFGTVGYITTMCIGGALELTAIGGIISLCKANKAFANKTPIHWQEQRNRSFHAAAQSRHFDLMKKHLANGAQIDSQDENGQTVFQKATAQDNIDFISFLMQNCEEITALMPKFANLKDREGNSLLHILIQNCRYDLAKNLINSLPKEFCFNRYLIQQNNDGYTVLHLAAGQRNSELVKLIAEKIYDTRSQDNLHNTAFDYATYFLHEAIGSNSTDEISVLEEIVKTLDPHYLGFKETVFGASISNSGLIQELLVSAVQSGYTELVKYLHQGGANLEDTKNLKYPSLLYYAAKRGYSQTLRYLLMSGLSFEHRKKQSDQNTLVLPFTSPETPFDYAAQDGHLHCIQIMLEMGELTHEDKLAGLSLILNERSSDQHNKSALTIIDSFEQTLHATEANILVSQAICNGYSKEILSKLVQLGANSTHCFEDGKSFMHIAACYGNVNAIEYFSRFKSLKNQKDKAGKTPLELANENNQSKAIAALEKLNKP